MTNATPDQIESALTAMHRAFALSRHWSSFYRYELCRKSHELLTARAEPFARLIAEEAKKPIRTARGEVARALTTFRLAMEESTRIAGEQIPADISASSLGYHAIVEHVPIGPCLFITPFNFPLNLVAHKVAPALAVGCPFIVKPSERTPRTALALGELLRDAGVPADFFHILSIPREETALLEKLVADPRLALLSFTGSADVGWHLKSIAGKKPVVLELGNNSAVIVEPDTDLADAIPRIVTAAFSYAGQSCISVQRIFLHATIADQAIALLVAATQKLKLGDPLDESTDVGPMIDEPAALRIESWINAAIHNGATALIGARREGAFYHPTLIRLPTQNSELRIQNSPLLTNEAFAPVALIETYTDFPAVLARVNDTPFGLHAGIFTRDLFKARLAFTTLDMGGIIINDVPTTRLDHLPYGGPKNSGLGREGVRSAIAHLTQPKVLLTRYP